MKKITFICLLLAFTSTAFAQELELGIKITPSIAGQRLIVPSNVDFEKEGANFRFGFGVIADLYFTENAAFSTGLSFTGKGGSVSYPTSFIQPGVSGRTTDDISLQYLEIPLTVKLFTNEVAPDMRVYFQTGFSLNPRMGAKVNGEKLDPDNKKYSKHFNVFDADVILGTGLEYQVGETTKLFGGLSYHRGLASIDDYYEERISDKIEVRNNIFSLDLGVKF
ncbi:porin family protein [Adhaeribacter radiodurans]|uniref:PorT family protein n=1 Tax=Adhaeribacter radiodurans TaxID=2745197 RepID=A0A7L7L2Q1_9BACT|nr:porin family protein [Adhaeribacter radiodurans]QMU27033.1 PorT family protein [Adhaeribacter radiodurans]